MDKLKALSSAVGAPVADHAPKYKCDKGHYKGLLKEVIKQADVEPLQGGAEYGQDVACEMDIHIGSREDTGFKFFIEQIKDWIEKQRPFF